MSHNATIVDDDADVFVVEPILPNISRDRHLSPDNVIVIDNPPPQRTTASSIEPIVIDEAPRKRRRREPSSHPPPTAPVPHPPHVIIVDDSDSPPIRPSVLAFRGRETHTTRVQPPRTHANSRHPSSSLYEEDIIEMAVSGPRLAPMPNLPPPRNLAPGNQAFLIEPLLSMTPISPLRTQRQSMPTVPELINAPLTSLNRQPDSAAPLDSLSIHPTGLPSIPSALHQSSPRPNASHPLHASRLVDIDHVLTNPRMPSHRTRELRTDVAPHRLPSAIRATSSPLVHSHRHPLRHAAVAAAPRRYVHLERDQVGSLGETQNPTIVRASSSRRQYASQLPERQNRYGTQYAPRFSSIFLTDESLSPIPHNHHQSNARQFSADPGNAPHPLESLARHRYDNLAAGNGTVGNINTSPPTSDGARLFQLTRSHSRRHSHMSSEVDDLSSMRHIQRRRDLHRARPSSRRATSARPVLRGSMTSFTTAQPHTLYGAERARRQSNLRPRAYARPTLAHTTLHRHSAPQHIAAVVQRMMHHVGGSPGLEIHYLHGFHGDHSLDYEHLVRLDEQLIREKNRADSDQIESLPVQKATAEDKEIRCCICMCDVEEGEELRVLPCAHKYHKSCIDGKLSLSFSFTTVLVCL
eukprot:TRINITY_DN789_c0_g1_i1.p1 TRINITY_DN789_c0_g1~~TRINITY_DN789_c0_g1_i1.p1  ORF type:complete len:742 (-),score=82.21 TRINITY_DN789_c0_g1_i1:1431-3341(-)